MTAAMAAFAAWQLYLLSASLHTARKGGEWCKGNLSLVSLGAFDYPPAGDEKAPKRRCGG